MEDEQRRIEAAKADPSRFAELYDEHFERVYAYVLRRVGDRSDAQDITADVFQDAFANLNRFEWRGAPFAAWLYRIAANAIADHFRRRSRPLPDAPPDANNENIERRAMLFRSVDRLPADQRRVIVMRFGEEKSIREIAEEMGRSEGAVKQLQWRGLQTLRTQMLNG
ncbi:MAG TPA: sigma-70 family RNA polymerase sigma factor [Thermoanaerobaculia bacterium]|jgi:RNA polymerase sigma-70 factor (ECF subfamily)